MNPLDEEVYGRIFIVSEPALYQSKSKLPVVGQENETPIRKTPAAFEGACLSGDGRLSCRFVPAGAGPGHRRSGEENESPSPGALSRDEPLSPDRTDRGRPVRGEGKTLGNV